MYVDVLVYIPKDHAAVWGTHTENTNKRVKRNTSDFMIGAGGRDELTKEKRNKFLLYTLAHANYCNLGCMNLHISSVSTVLPVVRAKTRIIGLQMCNIIVEVQ